MSDNVRLWMGAFKSMSVTERGYGNILITFLYFKCYWPNFSRFFCEFSVNFVEKLYLYDTLTLI